MPQTVLKNDLDVTGALTAGSVASDAGITGTSVTVTGAAQGATVVGTTSVKTPLLIFDMAKDLSVAATTQTNAAAVATIPDIVDAADEFVMKDTTQTLTLKTLTTPIINNPQIDYLLNPHNFGGAHADWDISTGAGSLYYIHVLTNADGAANVIVGAAVSPKWFVNTSGQTITVKTAAGTGIAIASTKTALVTSDGTNVIRLTADV